MDYEVRLEQLDARPLAVVRRLAAAHELSRVVPAACGEVWSVIKSQRIAGAGRHVAIYRDDAINIEVGVELESAFAGFGQVVASATPAGAVAVTVHHGPYHRLHEAHDAVRRWCAANGRVAAGPRWEVYGHWVDEWNRDPAKIRTDVFHLLRV